MVKAANEKIFCARNVPLLHFISQEVPSWNILVNLNSRRVKRDCAHKSKDKYMVVEIFIPVSETCKINRKREKKLIITHLDYKFFLSFIGNKNWGLTLK